MMQANSFEFSAHPIQAETTVPGERNSPDPNMVPSLIYQHTVMKKTRFHSIQIRSFRRPEIRFPDLKPSIHISPVVNHFPHPVDYLSLMIP